MGKFGSGWLVRYRKEKKLNENVFNDLIDYIISESKGISFIPSSDSLDRGVIALTEMNLVGRARYLIIAGTGTFQKWISAKFLDNQRYHHDEWSKITVCN